MSAPTSFQNLATRSPTQRIMHWRCTCCDGWRSFPYRSSRRSETRKGESPKLHPKRMCQGQGCCTVATSSFAVVSFGISVAPLFKVGANPNMRPCWCHLIQAWPHLLQGDQHCLATKTKGIHGCRTWQAPHTVRHKVPKQLHKRKVWLAGQKANINGFLPHRTQSSACHPGSAAGCRARARRPGHSPTETWLPVSSMQPLHANKGARFNRMHTQCETVPASTRQQEEHCPSKRLPHSLAEVLH